MFMKKESILESVSKTIEENTYVEIHPNLLLKKYQQRILDDYQIPYQECKNYFFCYMIIRMKNF